MTARVEAERRTVGATVRRPCAIPADVGGGDVVTHRSWPWRAWTSSTTPSGTGLRTAPGTGFAAWLSAPLFRALGSGTRACKRPGERPHTADSAETPYPAAVSTPQSDGMDEEPSGPGPDPSGDKRARARSLLKCQRRPSSHPGRPAKGADTVKIPSPAVPCRQAPVERAWAPEEWAGSTFPVPRPAASSSRSSALGCGGRTPTCSGPGAAEVH